MRNLLVEEEARRRTRKGGAGDSCIVQCIPADVGFLFHFFFFSFSTLFFRFGNSLLCVCVGMLCPWGLVPGTLMEYSCPLPPHHTVLMSVCLHWLEKRLGLFVIFQATWDHFFWSEGVFFDRKSHYSTKKGVVVHQIGYLCGAPGMGLKEMERRGRGWVEVGIGKRLGKYVNRRKWRKVSVDKKWQNQLSMNFPSFLR